MLELNQLLYDAATFRPSYTLDDIIKSIEEAKGEQFPGWLYSKDCYFADEAMLTYAKEYAKTYSSIDRRLTGIGMGIGHLKTNTVFEEEGGRLEYKIELDHYEALISPENGKLCYWMDLTESMVDHINKICSKKHHGSTRLYACTQSYAFLGRFSPHEEIRASVKRRRGWDGPPSRILDKRIQLIKTNGEKSDKIPPKDKKYEGVLKDWVGTLVRSRLFIPPKTANTLLPKHVQGNLITGGKTLDIKELKRRPS